MYTGLLAISLVAMIASCILLFLDYNQYGSSKAPAVPTTTPQVKPITQGMLPPPPPLEERPFTQSACGGAGRSAAARSSAGPDHDRSGQRQRTARPGASDAGPWRKPSAQCADLSAKIIRLCTGTVSVTLGGSVVAEPPNHPILFQHLFEVGSMLVMAWMLCLIPTADPLAVSQPALDVGQIYAGQPLKREFTVRNVGIDALTVSELRRELRLRSAGN